MSRRGGQPRWAHSKELAAHDLEPEDVPHVLLYLDLLSQFSSSGLPIVPDMSIMEVLDARQSYVSDFLLLDATGYCAVPHSPKSVVDPVLAARTVIE
jgi:hypothetical protein